MPDQALTTSIEDLVKYVNDHGETDSVTLSTALNVNEHIIETWAGVLENAKIVKVTYKLGKMFVLPTALTKEDQDVVRTTVAIKKETVQSDMENQSVALKQIDNKLDDLKKSVSITEEAFRNKAGQIKSSLDEIDKIGQQIDISYKKLKDKKDFMDQLSTRLNTETQRIDEKAKTAGIGPSADADSRRLIADIRIRLEDTDNKVKELEKNFENTIDESRKNFAALLTDIRNESRSLRDMLGQQDRALQEYMGMLNSYKKDSEATKRQIGAEKKTMLDEAAKSSEEARKIYSAATAGLDNVKKSLIELRGGFGGYADFDDKVNSIKSSIDAISKEKEELQKEVGDLEEQLKAASALSSSKLLERNAKTQAVEAGAAKTAKKVGALGKKADDVKKDVDDLAK